MSKVTLSLSQAESLAERVADELRPVCERIEVAGSIRRQCATVGDLELVVIPKRRGLWSDHGESLLDEKLNSLVRYGRLIKGKGGERYKRFLFPAMDGLQLDLYIVTPERWGVVLALRTGPAEFSRALVTRRQFGGRLDDELIIHDGRVWLIEHVITGMIDSSDYRGPFFNSSREPLETPEELDFLHLSGGWYDPVERACDLPIQDSFDWREQPKLSRSIKTVGTVSPPCADRIGSTP